MNLNKIKEVKWRQDPSGEIKLDLDVKCSDLPPVSILTITKNRKHLFPIAMMNWKRFVYPNALEWVIIDDGSDNLEEILPKDTRINYIKTDVSNIGAKRNLAVENARYDYLANMDDDDFYYADRLIALVSSLIFYKKECIYSHILGSYDINTKQSYILEGYYDCPEASMVYTKNFWKGGKFGEKYGCAESHKMVKNREKKMLKIVYFFNMITLYHGKNITGETRMNPTNMKSSSSYFEVAFDAPLKRFLSNCV